MKTIRWPAAFAFFLGACAAPRTTVETTDQSGTVIFQVDPSYAAIWIDGKSQGKARDFDGKSAVLKLPAGKHEILLRAEGFADYQTRIFLSNTQERIEVNLRKKE